MLFSLNSQYGVVGVPTVMLFHNGRPVAKFNRTDYTLLEFVNFLNEYTGKHWLFHNIMYESKVFEFRAQFVAFLYVRAYFDCSVRHGNHVF